ncbi:MAG: class I SAM-dependent methyltransferase [Bacteroidetes bacterium]|nr:class I SAM-dependent methyltransferase [Bacteroidota bacterium]
MDNNFSYSAFFIENWNTQFPNSDEAQRLYHILMALFRPLSENKLTKPKLLEVGSGRGWLSNILNLYTDVTGIEPEKEVSEYSQKMFPQIRFFNAGLNEFTKDNPNTKYDIIVCSEVIEHVPYSEQDVFVKNLSTLLSNNGTLILTTPRQEIFNKWKKNRNEFQTIENWLTEKEVESKLLEHGFSIKNHYSFSRFKPKQRYFIKKLSLLLKVNYGDVYQIILATK